MSPKHFSKLALSLLCRCGQHAAGRRRPWRRKTSPILGLEEMVVTAQKREENLQAVPISISALSATDIERRGVQNSADLVSAMPNMGGFISPGSRGDLSVTLRGVAGAAPSNLSNDPGVAIYLDGVILGKQVGNSLDVAELERVEVLRGPQGTLYGRNSTGGAVNFITKKPSGEFGGKITGTAGSDSLWGLRATVDTPDAGHRGRRRGHPEGLVVGPDARARRLLWQRCQRRAGIRRPRPPGLSRGAALGAERCGDHRLCLRQEQARRNRHAGGAGGPEPARARPAHRRKNGSRGRPERHDPGR